MYLLVLLVDGNFHQVRVYYIQLLERVWKLRVLNSSYDVIRFVTQVVSIFFLTIIEFLLGLHFTFTSVCTLSPEFDLWSLLFL